MSFLAKRTLLRTSFDLKYSNNLIYFLASLSHVTLFGIKLKLIADTTCLISSYVILTHDNLSMKVERNVLKKIPLYKIIRDMYKF